MYLYLFTPFWGLQKFTGICSNKAIFPRELMKYTCYTFHLEPCETISSQFTRPRGYAHAWERPAVISDLPRGLQKEGRGPCCP